MDSTGWGSPPAPGLLTGREPIERAGASLQDFWAWSMSDLRTTTVRSLLTEFLVARAVGAATRPRVEWDAYDVLTPDGARLEVTSGAYLQSWPQSRLSTIQFGGLSARTWSESDGCSAAGSYNADAYVFAVLTAAEHDRYDALDVEQWSFWVLPRHTVAATRQRTMRLSRVEVLAGPAVGYTDLAERIREVVKGDRS
ncbi:hypothetical protein SAMN06893096_10846 [Geodermatophilus pulveris]|uniref:Uncharacterized protein n=1 Tax=Geodermatophilus pulveris TaxID=1564159 RepID=A0A239HD25_9ACTN|nr:hypothetical protein [Geodermatophilus pulveris]SNS79299.1 hypothetical protein SAMN06893096_10846 [Geodermatophilus pulveris]